MKWAIRGVVSDNTQVRVLLDRSEEIDFPSPPETRRQGGMDLRLNTGMSTNQTTRTETKVRDEGSSDTATPPKVQEFSLLLQAAPAFGRRLRRRLGGRSGPSAPLDFGRRVPLQ